MFGSGSDILLNSGFDVFRKPNPDTARPPGSGFAILLNTDTVLHAWLLERVRGEGRVPPDGMTRGAG